MKDESIREGETFEVTLTDTDLTASTATITISNDTTHVQETASYSLVDGKMVATLTVASPQLIVGLYEYMYTVTYSNGFVAKFPDTTNCKTNCELPKFTVCEANDITSS